MYILEIFFEFSILESTRTKQKDKATSKCPLSLYDQAKVGEIHMRTFTDFGRILEHLQSP